MRVANLIPALAVTFLFAGPVHADGTATLEQAKPETVGFSTERLTRLDAAMKSLVDQQQLAGMVTLVARHGKIIENRTYGYQDLESKKPMQKDTIFRIYSMTKPLAGVAMMILYEEGKWRPNDPIARHIPEFANLKVYAGQDKDGKPILEAPKHAPTMEELMSHTAGFTYGTFGSSPVDKLYQQANLFQSANLKEFIEKTAQLPLAYQPGEGWTYSISVDIQGYLVEKLSGQTLGEFMNQRIFTPLGMKDTGFHVPEAKLPRLASIYVPAQGGGLRALPRDPNVSKEPSLPSGGGGLYSTANDYARFAQMLLNGGELGGVRVLAPSSVELMRTNVVSDAVKESRKFGIGYYRMQPGLGFGYDFAILEEPYKIGSTAGAGSYLWDGIAGTWFWVDPRNDLFMIGMIQRMMTAPGMPNVEDLSRQLVYQALVEPAK